MRKKRKKKEVRPGKKINYVGLRDAKNDWRSLRLAILELLVRASAGISSNLMSLDVIFPVLSSSLIPLVFRSR